jgi:hypothetical protein
VLAGAGAAHGDGAVDQPVVQPLDLGDVLRVVAVDQQHHVEIAVADMAEDRRLQPRRLQVLLGFGDAFGQAGDRHADIGREGLPARLQRQDRPQRIVPRLPQLAAFLGDRGPFEVLPPLSAAIAWTIWACSITPASVP